MATKTNERTVLLPLSCWYVLAGFSEMSSPFTRGCDRTCDVCDVSLQHLASELCIEVPSRTPPTSTFSCEATEKHTSIAPIPSVATVRTHTKCKLYLLRSVPVADTRD